MLLRWVAAAVVRASAGFRRVRGHQDIGKLITALDRQIKHSNLDRQEKAAQEPATRETAASATRRSTANGTSPPSKSDDAGPGGSPWATSLAALPAWARDVLPVASRSTRMNVATLGDAVSRGYASAISTCGAGGASGRYTTPVRRRLRIGAGSRLTPSPAATSPRLVSMRSVAYDMRGSKPAWRQAPSVM